MLQTFEDLLVVNILVLIVTGRAAGWVSALVTDLPVVVVGAIAENEGLFYPPDNSNPVGLTSIPNVAEHQ